VGSSAKRPGALSGAKAGNLEMPAVVGETLSMLDVYMIEV
jgi:hypothetical protein